MKQISQFQQSTKSDKETGLATEIIQRLWERMTMIYGGAWVNQYGEEDDGTWQKGLSGLTPRHIKHGLEKLVKNGGKWPPSLPEFRSMCRITAMDLGMPEFELAYHAACNGNWFHPFVYEVAARVGTKQLAEWPEKISRPAFEKAYDAVIDEMTNGLLTEFRKPINAPRLEKHSPSKPEIREKYLGELKQMLGHA